ncbi:MAG: hypothetical protein ACK55I_17615, partial [bacterium]
TLRAASSAYEMLGIKEAKRRVTIRRAGESDMGMILKTCHCKKATRVIFPDLFIRFYWGI